MTAGQRHLLIRDTHFVLLAIFTLTFTEVFKDWLLLDEWRRALIWQRWHPSTFQEGTKTRRKILKRKVSRKWEKHRRKVTITSHTQQTFLWFFFSFFSLDWLSVLPLISRHCTTTSNSALVNKQGRGNAIVTENEGGNSFNMSER